MIAFVLAAGWWILTPAEYLALGRHTIAAAAFGSNIQLWSEAGYFDPASETKPLLHLWSLGIEEQFYILWPVCLLAIHRLARSHRSRLAAVVLLAAVSFTANILTLRHSPLGAFYLPWARVWELLVGAGLALTMIRPGAMSLLARSPGRDAAAWLGLIMVAGAVAVFDGTTPFPGWAALMPVLGTALLIASGPYSWLHRRLLSARGAVFIGLIAYPLYLWHWPLLAFVRIVGLEDMAIASGAWQVALGAKVVAVGLAGLLSIATYRWWENSIRWNPRPTIVAQLVAAMLLIAMGGAATVRAQGFPRRIPADGAMAAAATGTGAPAGNPLAALAPRLVARSVTIDRARPADAEPIVAVVDDPACLRKYGLPNVWATLYCVESTPSVAPRVMVLGDSHARALWPAIAQAYGADGALVIGAGGCPFLRDVRYWRADVPETQSLCPIVADATFRAVDAADPDVIVVTARFAYYALQSGYGTFETRRPRIHFESTQHAGEPLAWLGEVVSRDLRRLLDRGRDVVLMLDVPELGFDPANCGRRRPLAFLGTLFPCAVSRSRVDERQQSYRAILTASAAAIGSPRLHIADPLQALCDQDWCYAQPGGEILYRDDNHLSAGGAAYVWPRLRPREASTLP